MKAEEEAREGRNAWCQPNLRMGKKKDPDMLDPIPSPGPSPFGGGKSREAQPGSKSKALTPAATRPQKPAAAASSSAMERLSPGSSGKPAIGGFYQSKDGAPTQTRSSGGGAGAQPEGSTYSGNSLKMSPGTGTMSTGGATSGSKGWVR